MMRLIWRNTLGSFLIITHSTLFSCAPCTSSEMLSDVTRIIQCSSVTKAAITQLFGLLDQLESTIFTQVNNGLIVRGEVSAHEVAEIAQIVQTGQQQIQTQLDAIEAAVSANTELQNNTAIALYNTLIVSCNQLNTVLNGVIEAIKFGQAQDLGRIMHVSNTVVAALNQETTQVSKQLSKSFQQVVLFAQSVQGDIAAGATYKIATLASTQHAIQQTTSSHIEHEISNLLENFRAINDSCARFEIQLTRLLENKTSQALTDITTYYTQYCVCVGQYAASLENGFNSVIAALSQAQLDAGVLSQDIIATFNTVGTATIEKLCTLCSQVSTAVTDAIAQVIGQVVQEQVDVQKCVCEQIASTQKLLLSVITQTRAILSSDEQAISDVILSQLGGVVQQLIPQIANLCRAVQQLGNSITTQTSIIIGELHLVTALLSDTVKSKISTMINTETRSNDQLVMDINCLSSELQNLICMCISNLTNILIEQTQQIAIALDNMAAKILQTLAQQFGMLSCQLAEEQALVCSKIMEIVADKSENLVISFANVETSLLTQNSDLATQLNQLSIDFTTTLTTQVQEAMSQDQALYAIFTSQINAAEAFVNSEQTKILLFITEVAVLVTEQISLSIGAINDALKGTETLLAALAAVLIVANIVSLIAFRFC